MQTIRSQGRIEPEEATREKDIMQAEVTTLGLGDSLDVANDIMTLGRVRHLSVVDDKNRLVGVVTQRDLLKASQGFTGIFRLIIGSVTERMIRRAYCPVLSVHA